MEMQVTLKTVKGMQKCYGNTDKAMSKSTVSKVQAICNLLPGNLLG